jgi:predicted nucleic-acid-binding Zn-ribbon protein
MSGFIACPLCGCSGYFGPASIVVDDPDSPNELHYVTCKRCGENYLVPLAVVRHD